MTTPQIGDIATLIKVAYRLYDDYRNIPGECQEICQKAREVAIELEWLQRTLTDSGYSPHNRYNERQEEIKKALGEAEDYLKTFTNLKPGVAVRHRVKKTVQFKYDARRIALIGRALDEQRVKLRDIKVDIILKATLRNLSPYQDPAAPTSSLNAKQIGVRTPSITTSTSTYTSDSASGRASVFTRAANGVLLAHRLHSRNPGGARDLRTQSRMSAGHPSSPDSRGTAIQKFVEDIVAQAESSKLYFEHTLADEHFEAYEKIAEWLGRIQKVVAQSPEIPGSTPDSLPIPTTNVSSTADHEGPPRLDIEFDLDDWSGLSSYLHHKSRASVRSPRTVADDGYSVTSAVVNDAQDGQRRASLQTTSSIHVANPYTKNSWVRCLLEVSRSEASLCVWATPTTSRTRPLHNGFGHRDLTPARALNIDTSLLDLSEPDDGLPIYRHAIHSGQASFPAIRHPAIDTECSIFFYQPQFIDQEDKKNPAGVTRQLKYRFESRADRDKVREMIYGKRLLASAGYQSVTNLGVCRVQTLSFWEDNDKDDDDDDDDDTPVDAPTSQRPSALYVTFPSNDNGESAIPNRVAEYMVIDCQSVKSASRDGKAFTLTVQPTSTTGGEDDVKIPLSEASRRSSLVSRSSTTSSNGSRRSFSSISTLPSFMKRQSSDPKPITCSVVLSDDRDEFRRDKNRVIKLLMDRFPTSK